MPGAVVVGGVRGEGDWGRGERLMVPSAVGQQLQTASNGTRVPTANQSSTSMDAVEAMRIGTVITR